MPTSEESRALLLYRSTVDHVVDPSSAASSRPDRLRDVREELLENSYHVATLDNDAERSSRVRGVHRARLRGSRRRRTHTVTSPQDPEEEPVGDELSEARPEVRPG